MSLTLPPSLLGERHAPRSALEAHEFLMQGHLTGQSLAHLVEELDSIPPAEIIEKPLGISLRTWQRLKAKPETPLDRELGGRLWKLAEIFSKASAVLGSLRAAETWMQQPALGLEGHRPLDLLATLKGTELVEQLLDRMEYGVYA
jgi:putative toxin-antitoxin system antitoxin component (TIGR02293 family)